MKIKQLFDSPNFTFEQYLNVHNISDIQEFYKPTGKYLDPPLNYDNAQECADLIMDNIDNYIF